jgi:hypothetical protein
MIPNTISIPKLIRLDCSLDLSKKIEKSLTIAIPRYEKPNTPKAASPNTNGADPRAIKSPPKIERTSEIPLGPL